jgi:hypothetical protein
MKKEIKNPLSFLCTEWGFCIDNKSQNELIGAEHLKAEEFACAVLKAEGMGPDFEIEWRRKIKNKFIEELGSEISTSKYEASL